MSTMRIITPGGFLKEISRVRLVTFWAKCYNMYVSWLKIILIF